MLCPKYCFVDKSISIERERTDGESESDIRQYGRVHFVESMTIGMLHQIIICSFNPQPLTKPETLKPLNPKALNP